ncbi:MAG: F0F1 ATP synthase subunit A [Firmicutes bacterium]|nr:F0F1 ATP synthase subunit A [Bacillota bacterium]
MIDFEKLIEHRIEELSQVLEHLTAKEVLRIGDVVVTSTVVNTWIVMGVLFAGVFLMTRRLGERPKGAQGFLEMIVDFVYGLIDASIGKEGRVYLPIAGTMFLFILALNLSWFIPSLVPPTTDLSTTAAFGVTTIILVQLAAIRKKGIRGYIKRFAEPIAIMFPMNVIEELVKPFSLSVRLFGNLFGEKTVVTILFILVPVLLPVPVMMLGVLMGGIQAFVFTLLTVVYLAMATKGH